MKKLFGLLIVTSLLILSVSSVAMAVPNPKAVNVSLADSSVTVKTVKVSLAASSVTVKAGEVVKLTAETIKQGSAVTDNWTGAARSSTMASVDGTYVSVPNLQLLHLAPISSHTTLAWMPATAARALRGQAQ